MNYRRHGIGVMALGLLVGGAFLVSSGPRDAFYQGVEASCWRMGSLLAVWWLAWDQVVRLPRWLWVALPVLVLVVVLRPKAALLAIPVVIVLVILQPRWMRTGRAPTRPPRSRRR